MCKIDAALVGIYGAECSWLAQLETTTVQLRRILRYSQLWKFCSAGEVENNMA